MDFYHYWPIRPERVYYHKSEADQIVKNMDKNLTAIFSIAHVRGWLYDLVLHFNEKFQSLFKFPPPMSLIQFAQGCNSQNPKYEMLELDLLNDNTHKVCHYNKESEQYQDFCKHFDIDIASLFLGKNESELQQFDITTVNAKIISSIDILQGAYDNSYNYYDKNINVLHYLCPISNVSIIAIPLILSGIVVAVFIVGQFIIDRKKTLANLKRTNKTPELKKKQDYKAMQEISKCDYLEICDFYTQEVALFVQHLDERMHRNADTLIFKHIKTITEKVNIINNEMEIYADICKTMSLESIDMFKIDERKRLERDRQFIKISEAIDDKSKDNYPTEKLTKLNILNDNDCKNYNSLIFIPHYAHSFPHGLLNKTSERAWLIITYQDDITIKYGFLLTPILDLNEKEMERLARFIDSISSVLYAKKLFEDTKLQKDQYDLTLKMIGHELGQQIIAANAKLTKLQYLWSDLNAEYGKARPHEFGKMFESSDFGFETFYKDLESILENISMQAELAKSKSNSVRLKKKLYFIYDKSLFKIRSCFQMLLREKNMALIFETNVRKDDPLRPEIYGDQISIEQLVFNLVNNAIKYGYKGTKIYIDCKKQKVGQNEPHIITVSDYGCNIPEEMQEKIFELNVRAHTSYPGEGFGLYLVQEIAELHDGKAACSSSKLISLYNIPLIQTCIDELDGDERDQDFKILLNEEKERLIANGEYDKIVNKEIRFDKRLITRDSLFQEIHKATYEVIFEIEIASMHMQEEEKNV